MPMVPFERRILFVGFGFVARCTLPVLLEHLRVEPGRITILEFDPDERALAPWLARGVNLVRARVGPDNLGEILSRQLAAGDLLIDLAWNIDCCEILQWCHDHGVLYINTSVELWDPYAHAAGAPPTKMTLYWRQMNIRRMVAGWSAPGPTAVLEHGANPGLISHFTKHALLEIAAACLAERRVVGPRAELIAEHAAGRAFNLLAHELGVKVIHCSERDTQISSRPKEVDEFVNTWSVEGFREEGTTTAEMGWGTHEKELPPFAYQHAEGPRSQICLARMGINTQVVSWVPHCPIVGMVVRHGEAFSITEALSVRDAAGTTIYRPTVHYAYCPCDAAIASLWELRGNDFRLQSRHRVMTDEITSGSDRLGALVMGHPLGAWWCGTDLSIEESRRLVPNQNATTVQVAISVVAATLWMIENPAAGVKLPDELPHEFVLGIARPYLGRFLSLPSDWTPLKHYSSAFHKFNRPAIDRADPWQFKNFLLTDGD